MVRRPAVLSLFDAGRAPACACVGQGQQDAATARADIRSSPQWAGDGLGHLGRPSPSPFGSDSSHSSLVESSYLLMSKAQVFSKWSSWPLVERYGSVLAADVYSTDMPRNELAHTIARCFVSRSGSIPRLASLPCLRTIWTHHRRGTPAVP